MTRINLVHPEELCDQHILAEHRELPRIPNTINSGKLCLDPKGIPEKYTVRTNDNPSGGKGHMKFFINKLDFLEKRYQSLRQELKNRGFSHNDYWPKDLRDKHPDLFNDYNPSTNEIYLNQIRIKENMPKNPRYTSVNKRLSV